MLAVTDHNHVGGVSSFRAAAEGSDIHIFPGFELSSREGIHVLCIYALDTAEDLLARYLGMFGITDTNPSAKLADKTFVDILAKVHEQGGIAVAAHVTNANGLLKTLSGQARIHAWRSKHLLAVQIPGPVADLPQDLRHIVENTNPDYRREHAAEDRLAIAVVNAKDIAKPEDLDDRSATCWIKMSEVSIEGLRQAFLDPGSRIRPNPKEGKLEHEEHAELVALAWEGGFLDGAAIHFNPNLNVLVGGARYRKIDCSRKHPHRARSRGGRRRGAQGPRGHRPPRSQERDKDFAPGPGASPSGSRVPHRAHHPESAARSG